MALVATTPSALRAALITYVVGLTPRTRASDIWSHQASVQDVPGLAVRNFHVRLMPGAPREGGIHGTSEVEYVAELRIYTNYANLRPSEAEEVIQRDAAQLWESIDVNKQSVNTGIISFESAGEWVAEDEDESEQWGYHPFTITYLASIT